MTVATFVDTLSNLAHEGLRILLSLALPALLIPASAVVAAFVLAFFSLRDEGLQYAVRSLMAIVLVGALGSAVMASLVELMRAALMP
jgi:flagellar biosynthesis protein FliQ